MGGCQGQCRGLGASFSGLWRDREEASKSRRPGWEHWMMGAWCSGFFDRMAAHCWLEGGAFSSKRSHRGDSPMASLWALEGFRGFPWDPR